MHQRARVLLGPRLDARRGLRLLRQARRRPSFGTASASAVPERGDVRPRRSANRLRHRIRWPVRNPARPELHGVRRSAVPRKGLLLRRERVQQRHGALVLPPRALAAAGGPASVTASASAATARAVRLRRAPTHQLPWCVRLYQQRPVRKRSRLLLRRRLRLKYDGLCVLPSQQAPAAVCSPAAGRAAAEPRRPSAVAHLSSSSCPTHSAARSAIANARPSAGDAANAAAAAAGVPAARRLYDVRRWLLSPGSRPTGLLRLERRPHRNVPPRSVLHRRLDGRVRTNHVYRSQRPRRDLQLAASEPAAHSRSHDASQRRRLLRQGRKPDRVLRRERRARRNELRRAAVLHLDERAVPRRLRAGDLFSFARLHLHVCLAPAASASVTCESVRVIFKRHTETIRLEWRRGGL